MARIVLLDSGPLGLACSRPGLPNVDACHAWLSALEAAAVEVLIPTVADYEVRRELERVGATAKLQNLDDLAARFDVVDVLGPAFRQAATVGAPGDVVTVATTNVRHLARFPGIDAAEWHTVT